MSAFDKYKYQNEGQEQSKGQEEDSEQDLEQNQTRDDENDHNLNSNLNPDLLKSFNDEMLEQELELKNRNAFDKKLNTNILRFNAFLCLIIIGNVIYFIIGHNYILNWTPNKEQFPDKVYSLGIKSFRINGFATFYSCLDYKNNCSVSDFDLCRNSYWPILTDFKSDCEGLKAMATIGIIFIVSLALGLVVNLITLISIFSLLKEHEKLPEIGVSISKFEFLFYVFASVEYLFHILFLDGNYSYRYPIVFLYSAALASLANIISFRLAFYRYIRIKTRDKLINTQQDF